MTYGDGLVQVRYRRSRSEFWIVRIAAMILLVGVAVLVTMTAWTDLVYRAMRDEEKNYILLVPFVSIWLMWVRRIRFRLIEPHGQWGGTVIIAIGWIFYSLGDQYLVETGWYLGAVLIVVGGIISIGGYDLLKHFKPSFLVLLFMIPVPGMLRPHIAGPLQTATAAIVQHLFGLFGHSVTRNGNLLFLDAGPIAIAEACNGLRMVFALILVSYTVAFTIPANKWVRVTMLIGSLLLAIVCNIVRLVPTLWAYRHLSRDTADALHDAGGWIMVLIAFVLLLSILRLLKWLQLPVTRINRVGDQ